MSRGTSFTLAQPAVRPRPRLGLAVCLATLASVAGPAPALEARRFRVDAAKSRIDVAVGTAGLFRFAGHAHAVRVPVAEGEIVADPDNVAAASVWLRFESAAIRVVSAMSRPNDVRVQEKMTAGGAGRGAFPEARFASRREPHVGKSPASSTWTSSGMPSEGDEARGRAGFGRATERGSWPARVRFKPSDFGIEPVSVAGLVKVKNEQAARPRDPGGLRRRE
jgi:polyisoprenoid-binding protein YceI